MSTKPIYKYVRIEEYIENNQNLGVFQDHNKDIKSFVEAYATSTRNDTDIYNIFEKNNRYWVSSEQGEQFITLSLKHHAMKISGFSAKSCSVNYCFKDINILGSNKGAWETICNITNDNYEVYDQITNSVCQSEYFYQRFKFSQTGQDKNGTYRLIFHYLDLYGELIPIQLSYLTRTTSFLQIHYSLIILMILMDSPRNNIQKQ